MCIEDDCPEDFSTRRSFLTGATATLASFALLSAAEADAQTQNAPTRVLDDPSIQHGRVVFKHNGVETIDGYLARPKADGVYPSVLVIAGNRITEEYIPNTCAALAVAGFVGLAPNIFHILPDTARTLAEMRAAGANHTDLDVLQDLDIGADYLRQQSFVKPDTMGVLGFCYGGKIAMLYGARSRQIDAVVPFHPGVTKASEVKRLKVPVQIHHGTADQAVALAESERLVKELKSQQTPVELFTYEGAGHGFLAYTRPAYNAEAGKLAWRRAVLFLHKYLGS
ncbi:MAG TPA: dienelactone hydrolase family protein [Pyrinomonadaceae bacterium]